MGHPTFADAEIPGSAAAAAAGCTWRKSACCSTLPRSTDDDLTRPTPTHWGEHLPLWQLLWTSIVEQFHHGAEIGTLRDLKRGHANNDWWPELQSPDWWPL